MREPVVLAFSGGLDTSWCVPHLAESTGRPVFTVTVDTGGLDEASREALARRSAALGAAGHTLVDARREYFHDVLRFLVFGNVKKGGTYPLSVGAERSVQARGVARVARETGAAAIAHGSTGAGNDQVRFEVALRAIAPGTPILAPVRDGAVSRPDQVTFLESRGLPVPAHGAAYSVNRGLWGTTIGGRETRSSDQPLPEAQWVVTRGAFDAPRAPERHTLSFTRGVPSAWDGRELDPVALLEEVERSAAPFGIGRGIHLGETILGIKGRVAFEAPAAETILTAHRELEKLVLSGRQIQAKETVASLYGELVHAGQLLEPSGRDLEAFLLSSQRRVTGVVDLLFRPGSLFVLGVASPYSLLAASKAAYGESAGDWTAADARGFSRLVALPAELHARAGRAAGLPEGDERAWPNATDAPDLVGAP
jgi:argininosuccinate synthase